MQITVCEGLMGRAGRKRKIGVERFPSGKIRIEQDDSPSPTLVKRASLMAMVGLCDASYGTMAGVFYLSRKLSAGEYEACKRFGTIYSGYLGAIGGPKAPSGQSMERTTAGASQGDLSPNEIDRHIEAINRYNDAHYVLRGAGRDVEGEVIRFCHGVGETPCGHEAMIRLRKGLGALIILWKIK